MDDLVQFVRDRLDEEERVARDAEREMTPGGFSVESLCIHLPPEVQEHNGRHNPARVLADIAAKRQMVARIENHALLMGRDEIHGDLLRLLAAPYADHPAYKEKWRP